MKWEETTIPMFTAVITSVAEPEPVGTGKFGGTGTGTVKKAPVPVPGRRSFWCKKIVKDCQDLPLKQTEREAVECNFVPEVQHDHIILILLKARVYFYVFFL